MKIRPKIRNRYLLAIDLILTAASVLGAYSLRLEFGAQLSTYLPSAYWMIGTSLVIKPLIYYFFGLYRRIWAYASVQELKIIVAAVTSASIPVAMVIFTASSNGAFDGFPRSIPFIDWVLSLIMIGGSRLVVRVLSESQKSSSSASGFKRHALIIGAGDAGRVGGARTAEEPPTQPAADRLPG